MRVFKNKRASISSREGAALSLIAESFISTTDRETDRLSASGSIYEVNNE